MEEATNKYCINCNFGKVLSNNEPCKECNEIAKDIEKDHPLWEPKRKKKKVVDNPLMTCSNCTHDVLSMSEEPCDWCIRRADCRVDNFIWKPAEGEGE